MSIAQKQTQQVSASNAKLSQQASQNPIKQMRPSKLLEKAQEGRQFLRLAKSGSVKQKLNLENAKLKINVQNLSNIIWMHKSSEQKLKSELCRNRDKLSKYKQKVKQKDTIITKLLDKLEANASINANSLKNHVYQLHQQHIKSYKQKIDNNEPIQAAVFVRKYEQLLKQFLQKQKGNLSLQHDKQQLSKNVNQLKSVLELIANKNNNSDQNLLAKLQNAQKLLAKEELVRKLMLDKIRHSEIPSQIHMKIGEIEKQRKQFISKDYEKANAEIPIEIMKQKVAEFQMNLFKQREQREQTEKRYRNYEQQYEHLLKKYHQSNEKLSDITKAISNIQQLLANAQSNKGQSIQALQKSYKQLEVHKDGVEEMSNNLKQTIESLQRNTKEWSQLEHKYLSQIQQLIHANKQFRNQIEMEQNKMSIFQLQLLSYNESNPNANLTTDQLSNQNKHNFINQILHQIITDLSIAKTQNNKINAQLAIYEKQIEKYQKSNGNFSVNSQMLDNDKVNDEIVDKLAQDQALIAQLQQKIANLEFQIGELQQKLQQSSEQNSHSAIKTGIKSTGKILQKGQVYLQKSDNEGGYQVNIINANDICPQVQNLTFEELAYKYEAARDEITYLSQKIAETVSQESRIRKLKDSKDLKKEGMILEQHEDEQSNSRDIDEDVYRNINEQMDRLINKNKTLQAQMGTVKHELQNSLNIQHNINNQLRQKLKQGQHINTNLSNIVIQLEADLSKYHSMNTSEHQQNSFDQQQDHKNLQLMQENKNLQNMILKVRGENEENMILLKQANETIEAKQRELKLMVANTKSLQKQIQLLAIQKDKVFNENEKINNDLKNIESALQKLTNDKVSNVSNQQSTFNSDPNKTQKHFSQSNLPQINQNQQQYNQPTAHLALQAINKKLQTLESEMSASSHKSRPNFNIPSFQQLPILQLALMTLIDRLNFVWSLVEERTQQYNQLRDQMSIISIECMKGAKMEQESQRPNEKVNSGQIAQQRYEQILAELIEYENENKKLEKEVSRLKQQITVYKKEIEDIQSKYLFQVKSQSSDQTPYNQSLLNRILEGGTQVELSSQKQMPQIIKLFLTRIKQLQGNLQNIEDEFDLKNKKLENLIQKQKSFISEKQRQNNSDESISSDRQKQPNTHTQMSLPKSQSNMISRAAITPSGVVQQKSYSLNSAKVFKEIEQLTRNNEELRDKMHKMKSVLENVSKVLESFMSKYGQSMEEKIKQQLVRCIHSVSLECDQDSKKDNSGFDIEGDIILSSSFAQKIKGNAKLQHQGLQQIKNTLEGDKSKSRDSNDNQQSKGKLKKQNSASKFINSEVNLKFLEENKFLFQELVQKVNLQSDSIQDSEVIKKAMSTHFNDKQIQQILYLNDSAEAVAKITKILHSQDKQSNNQNLLAEQGSIQQGEWVETEQLQSIINEIYPTKSDLCVMVANSINMLMLSQTKEGILKCIQYLFSNLKVKENEHKDEIRRREESVSQYGKKLQKLLMSKYSDQQSQDKSELLNENSFRKTTEFKSEYQIKKEEEDNNSNSKSNSHSHSGFLKQ